MPVLAAEATLGEIKKLFEDKPYLLDCMEIDDLERHFVEDGITYNVFALFNDGIAGIELKRRLKKEKISFFWL